MGKAKTNKAIRKKIKQYDSRTRIEAVNDFIEYTKSLPLKERAKYCIRILRKK